MSSSSLVVRDSTLADVPSIQAIYSHHVLHGTASFEIEPPTVDQMHERRAEVVSKGLPYIVAERGGVILGYGYATLYRARPAYRFTCEDSVYVHKDMARQGVGAKLLAEVISRCTAGGWRQMIAVIGDNNPASMAALLNPPKAASVDFPPVDFTAGITKAITTLGDMGVATAKDIYYLPGTPGWGPSYGGCPTARWVLRYPVIINTPKFGVHTNRFGFVVSWASNAAVAVEASTSLAELSWTALSNTTITNGSFYFGDPDWTNHSTRFYRIRSP